MYFNDLLGHQKNGANWILNKLKDYRQACLFWEPRVGKTLAMLEGACLFGSKILFVSTDKGCSDCIEQIEEYSSFVVKYVDLRIYARKNPGLIPSKLGIKTTIATKKIIYLINYESLHHILMQSEFGKKDWGAIYKKFTDKETGFKAVASKKGGWVIPKEHKLFDVVIGDECQILGGGFPKINLTTLYFKAISWYSSVILSSGTPLPETFSSAYYLLNVVDTNPWRHISGFYKWADKFVVKAQKYIGSTLKNDYTISFWDNNTENNQKIIKKAKEKKLRFTIEGLKNVSFVYPAIKHIVSLRTYNETYGENVKNINEKPIYIEMPEELQEICRTILNEGIYRHLVNNKEFVIEDTPASPKLLQLMGGTCIARNFNTGEEESLIFSNFKVKKAFDICNKFKKGVIFYKFKAEQIILNEYFKKQGWTVTENPSEFNNQKENIVYIVQYLRGREGINLSTSDIIIFYSVDWSFLSYYQAKQRINNLNRINDGTLFVLCSYFKNKKENISFDKTVWDTVSKNKSYTKIMYQSMKEGLNA